MGQKSSHAEPPREQKAPQEARYPPPSPSSEEKGPKLPEIRVRNITPNRVGKTWLERAQTDFDKCVALIKAKEWTKAHEAMPHNICFTLKHAIDSGWKREEKKEFDEKYPPITIEVTFSDVKQSITHQWSIHPFLTINHLVKYEIEVTRGCWTPLTGWTLFVNDQEYPLGDDKRPSWGNQVLKAGDKILIHSPKLEEAYMFE